MTENTESESKKAVLVGVRTGSSNEFDLSMKELWGLCEACGYEPVGTSTQNLLRPENSTYIGKGKIAELKCFMEETEAQCAVFLNDLTPSQLSNLCSELDCEVMDKTALILNIFSDRARTKEAKLQVESARLKYMLPRLSGMRKNLSRQGGTGGSMSNKGSGEKQLELDRRHIEKRLAQLRRSLEAVEGERETQRQKRKREGIPLVAMVGYTNAGKSTLMNKLMETFPASAPSEKKTVFARDMLFATLDTTVRRIRTDSGREFLLSDTVGFIKDLPHELIKAFRSTLEEAKRADLILNVVDYSDPSRDMQMRVTEETLRELGASSIPVIHVMNKSDRALDTDEFLREAEDIEAAKEGATGEDKISDRLPLIRGDRIYMSAKTGEGIAELAEMIAGKLYEDYIDVELLIPYSDSGAEHELRGAAVMESVEYGRDGICVKCALSPRLLGKYREYVI